MRVILYDATETSPAPELKDAWRAGARLYRALGQFNRIMGVGSWNHATSFLRGLGRIDEVQFWGHGSPGRVYLDGKPLDPKALEGIDCRKLFWFRTCASFAGPRGHEFAEDVSEALGCRVAAHTFNIGLLQSGLRSLAPLERAYWHPKEGFGPDGRTLWSGLTAPHTITCLRNDIPAGW